MLYETLGFDINYVKLVDSASFQCFTGVSNHMHLTKLASLGWMITLWIINEFEKDLFQSGFARPRGITD